ncbi:MAG: GNAT family N-acetyltransferase [Lachnospiraceae bacterium]|nr:GNAT family N-acetyltransferase [Lachnospiraceae bacterium]
MAQRAYEIIRLVDRPELKERAAQWFHEKWGIPLEAYQESMEQCLAMKSAVPQWYLAMEGNQIIGGMGVIENDFHDRKDLAPNVCAVYTEEQKRGQGVAGALLGTVCTDMKERGIDTLYLLTDHTSFYERYGWKFLCMVQGDGEPELSRMYVHVTV